MYHASTVQRLELITYLCVMSRETQNLPQDKDGTLTSCLEEVTERWTAQGTFACVKMKRQATVQPTTFNQKVKLLTAFDHFLTGFETIKVLQLYLSKDMRAVNQNTVLLKAIAPPGKLLSKML